MWPSTFLGCHGRFEMGVWVCSVTRLLRGRRCSLGCARLIAWQSRVRSGRSASEAHCSLSARDFAEDLLARNCWSAHAPASRQAVPGRGDLCGGEEHRAGVGAQSALRPHACRSCLSAESEANAASSSARPRIEHRSAVEAKRRPPQCEHVAGTACREANKKQLKDTTP